MSLVTLYRTKLKTYIMLLCIMYLVVIALFHLDIQHSEADISQRPRLATNAMATLPYNRSTRMVPRASMSYPVYETPAGQIPFGFLRPEEELARLLAADKVKHVAPKRNSTGSDVGVEYEFVEVIKRRLFVFSAYWDTRPNDFDNRQNGSFVRMMAVASRLAMKSSVWCSFETAGGRHVNTPVRYYEMCENHGRPYGGFILSCPAPSEIRSRPSSVGLSTDASQPAVHRFKVLSLLPEADRQQFAVCVPPLYGNIDVGHLVEFIEMTRTLGAQRIVFYDYRISAEVADVLEKYRDRGLVDVVPWYYPNELEMASWYHGQLVAIQDCLYRNMRSAEYLSFNDLDEYIVPRVHGNWAKMMEAMFGESQCAFQFSSAFFPPAGTASDSVVFSATRRSERLSSVRTKCMTKPYLIFEQGIHHVSKPIWADLRVSRMPEHVGFVHHYRHCIRDFFMNCKQYVDDNFMQKFADEVRSKLSKYALLS